VLGGALLFFSFYPLAYHFEVPAVLEPSRELVVRALASGFVKSPDVRKHEFLKGDVIIVQKNDDLISVHANTRHWFDMGPNPTFTAIRLFKNPDGCMANLTGDDIAQDFPLLEN